MLTLLSQARFWTLRDDIVIKDTDFGAFKFYEKKDSTDSIYRESKKQYAEKRGMTWNVSNRRPNKLRDSVKELDEQLINHRVVFCQWRDDCLLQVMFSSGLLANICVDISTGDILKVSFDKYLIGKLLSEYVVDVVFTKTHIVCSYNDNQITLVYLSKPCVRPTGPEKLSRLDPRLHTVELAGPSGRRLERRLSANTSGDTVLVWWRCGRDEVYPWSPVVRDQDRANVHVYSISGTRAQLLCWYRTDHDPIWVSFSLLQPSLILSVEQKVSRKGEVTVESGRYEVRRARLQRSAVASVPLQTQVCCLSFSPAEDKLLLGCIDGSLVLFDEARGVTHVAKAAFISSLVSWHPGGALVLVANDRCQIQCFDAALAAVRHQLAGGGEDPPPGALLDLATYCGRRPPTLRVLTWAKPSRRIHAPASGVFSPADGLLLLLLDRGPLAALRLVGGAAAGGLGVEALVSQYLSLELPDRALALLLTLSWDSAGESCLCILQRIIEHLLRVPLTPATAGLLQSALGCFHMPSRPMSPATEVQYSDQVRDLTRRFFHHLLRYQQFEKAFRLAIDLQDRDLFVDLYFYAQAVHADAMAIAAREKAQELLNPDRQESSSGSEDSCSCSESGSAGSGEGQQPSQEPPPLPIAKPSSQLSTAEGRPSGEKQKVKFSDTVTHIALPDSCSSDAGGSPPLMLSSAPLRYVPALPSAASRRSMELPGAWPRSRIEELPLLGSHGAHLVTPQVKRATAHALPYTSNGAVLQTDLLLKGVPRTVPQYKPTPTGGNRTGISQTPNAFLPGSNIPVHSACSVQYTSIPRHSVPHPSVRQTASVCAPSYRQQTPPLPYGNPLYAGVVKEPLPRTSPHYSRNLVVNSVYPNNKENFPQALSHSLTYQQFMQSSSQATEHSDRDGLGKGTHLDIPVQHDQENGPCRRLQDLVSDGVQEEESLRTGSIKVVHFGVV
ncbi:hypothetical protein R5R35_000322 [Gryllus longicercus]|uniref:WD repeat-containing and planar cell polarity effector protein fritz n=1 Tax=Gryllus longicercus TaxID=2509291 RepID=A0AAN9WM10_9ORTH